ncbi:hypothetical protein EWM64_g7557 [Hericium alpestre]|uniref:Protein kinase domain-containing protein n=1 Tax=Hericium alpestre TaxID=135208 RepID=A0A4Y9ZQZ5_9AGAM|nr:hypothetical protein EWM64_g7557 [Hericium alpestre]
MATYGGSEVRPITDVLIAQELRGACLPEVDGLVEHIFPPDTLSFNVEQAYQHIKSATRLYRDGEWYHVDLAEPIASDEDAEAVGDVFGPQPGGEEKIANLFNAVAQAIGESSGISPAWYWSAEWAEKPLPPLESCTRKPDTVLLPKNQPPGEAHWKDPRSIGEIKGNSRPQNVKDADRGLKEDARLTFGHQANRRYVVGLTLCGAQLRVSLFDRRFIYVLGSLVFGDNTALGYDPTINLTSDPQTIQVQGETYEILDVVHIASVIRGRGTVCYRVTRDGQNFIIKDYWADTARQSNEAELLKEAIDISGLAGWCADEDLRLGDTDDTTASHGRTLLDDLDDYPNAEDYQNLEIRIHRRIVLKDCGTPIQNFSTRRELVGVFIDTIKTHRALHDLKKILHRDISLRNIMIFENGSLPGKRPGLLIDIDYSVKTDREFDTDLTNHRTGTLPFMAIDVLNADESVEHKAYHDLESFFYVLFWICITMEGPGRPRGSEFDVEKSELRHWFIYGDFKLVGLAKDQSLRKPSAFAALLAEIHPYFDALRECIQDLRNLFLSRTVDTTPTSVSEIYDSVLTILGRARDALPEEDPVSLQNIADPWPQIAAGKRKAMGEKKKKKAQISGRTRAPEPGSPTSAVKCRRELQGAGTDKNGSRSKKSKH